MVELAVEGLPDTTGADATCAPSSVKVTVPVGGVLPAFVGVMVAVTANMLPGAGVLVPRVKASVAVLWTGLMFAWFVAAVKFPSPAYVACIVCVVEETGTENVADVTPFTVDNCTV
jgi:hypothetical protein